MNKVALVTGASSGIGRALLDCFAADGIDLVITARDEAALTKAAEEITKKYGVSVTTIPADLSEPGAARWLFDEVERRGLVVEYLVNNAGFGHYGFFHEADAKKMDDMVQVNVAALVTLTRLFLPGMVARRSGRILQVSSLAGFQPGPLMAVYYATKAFVTSFSEAIAEELSGTGVTVTCLCPGPVHTQFAARAEFNHSRIFQKSHIATAEEVAAYGYRAMMAGKVLAVHGFNNRLLAFIGRFIPRRILVKLVRWMQEKREGSTDRCS